MDAIIIVLIIIIIVLIYFLYSSTKKASANTSSQLYNLNNGITAINSSELTNPKSQSFSYSTWIFVNTWSTTTTKMIYNTPNVISLALGTVSPTLTVKIGTNANAPITITQNFPIQKWVYVVVSVDSQTVDCYLDGKLLTSTQLSILPVMSDTYAISFGTFDAYLTGFKYESKPLNPQQVWTNYMAGNGYTGGKYGVNVALTKDDAIISQVSY